MSRYSSEKKLFKPVMLDDFSLIRPKKIRCEETDQNLLSRNAYTGALNIFDNDMIESKASVTSSAPEINRDVP